MGGPSLEQLNQIALPILSADKSLYLGPFMIATFVDTLFCGILLMQCGAYYTLGKQDRKLFKGMVLYVLILNIAATLFTWTWIYDLFVYNFGSYGLFLSIKYLSWFYVLDSMMVIVVQAFFGLRAWSLMKKNWFVGAVILSFMLAAFAGGVGIKVIFTKVGSTLFAGDVRIPAYICLFCTVAADLTITGIIIYYFKFNRTGNQNTDHMLSRLTSITFQSQLPPTLIAIALAIEYSIKYDSFIAIPFICVQGKVYAISLLHTLNVRESWRRPNVICAATADIEFQQPSQPTVWGTNTTDSGVNDSHRHTRVIHPEVAKSWNPSREADDKMSGETASLDAQGQTFCLSHIGTELTNEVQLPRKKDESSV